MFEALDEETWIFGDREHAVKQLTACALALRELFDASAGKLRTQRALLLAVAKMVTAPRHGEAMLEKTPAILMTLYVEAPPSHSRVTQ